MGLGWVVSGFLFLRLFSPSTRCFVCWFRCFFPCFFLSFFLSLFLSFFFSFSFSHPPPLNP